VTTTGNKRPRTKPPEERRKELMTAARRLFLEQGVDATSVEQITTRAQVAKGTFYLYFKSKEEIHAALGDSYGDELLLVIREAVGRKAQDDWRGRLAIWASACVGAYLDSIRLHDILFYGSRPATREGLADNVLIDDLRELLEAGSDAGAWSIDDPRLTAVFLFSGLHAVVDDAHSRNQRVNRGRLGERVQRLFFQVVGVSAAL
jgi:AcrR family transcriptional regulator